MNSYDPCFLLRDKPGRLSRGSHFILKESKSLLPLVMGFTALWREPDLMGWLLSGRQLFQLPNSSSCSTTSAGHCQSLIVRCMTKQHPANEITWLINNYTTIYRHVQYIWIKLAWCNVKPKNISAVFRGVIWRVLYFCTILGFFHLCRIFKLPVHNCTLHGLQ